MAAAVTDIDFVVAIPARHGSSRLPGKPLRLIVGEPMISHVVRRAVEAGAAEVVVATDDQRIADVVSALGITVCMTSRDHASGTDRLAECVAQRGWRDDRIVVNLQGDEPLAPPAAIRAVAACLAGSDAPLPSYPTVRRYLKAHGMFRQSRPKRASDGALLALSNPRAAIAAGIGLLPEERKREGIIPGRSVTSNMALPSMKRFSSGGIINHGKLIANKPTRELVAMAREKVVELTLDRDLDTLPGHPAFVKCEKAGERTVAITYDMDKANAGEVLSLVQSQGFGIVDVSTREADLEDVFVSLTSKAAA